MGFDQLHLVPALLSNVRAAGYSEPTPIQRETIPLVLDRRDILGCAQTGTGKTAAFALPILQILARNPGASHRDIRALILTPTRELAQQIYDNIVLYGKGMTPRACVIFGGVGQQNQLDALEQGSDILVACPGRLLDLMNQGFITLEQGTDILGCLPYAKEGGAFLLDSVTALLSNEMFRPGGETDWNAGERVAQELRQFALTCGNAVFVSDFIYSDAGRYDEYTETYRRGLALCDRTLCEVCDAVVEVCSSNLILHKGALPV